MGAGPLDTQLSLSLRGVGWGSLMGCRRNLTWKKSDLKEWWPKLTTKWFNDKTGFQVANHLHLKDSVVIFSINYRLLPRLASPGCLPAATSQSPCCNVTTSMHDSFSSTTLFIRFSANNISFCVILVISLGITGSQSVQAERNHGNYIIDHLTL